MGFQLPTSEDVLWKNATACLIAQRETILVGQAPLRHLLHKHRDVLRLLEELAFHQRFCGNPLSCDFAEEIAIQLAQGDASPKKVARTWLQQCVYWGLLGEREEQTTFGVSEWVYFFTIPTLDEYFAARHLAHRWRQVKEHRDTERWTPEDAHYAAWLPSGEEWWDRRPPEPFRCAWCGQELAGFGELLWQSDHRNLLLLLTSLVGSFEREEQLLGWVLQSMGKEEEDGLALGLQMLSRCCHPHPDVIDRLAMRSLPGSWSETILDGYGVLGRARCASNLVQMRDVLIQALEDADASDWVRQAAAIALGWLGNPRAFEPLRQALEDADASEEVRRAAAWALGRLGDGRAVEPLRQALEDADASEGVRRAAAWALGQLGDARAFELLRQALEDADASEGVRRAAAWALGRLGDARAVEPLRQALKDADASEGVRRAAAWALGRLGEPGLQALIQALEDTDASEGVRRAAAWALGRLGEPGLQALIQALEDTDASEEVRRAAAEALEWIRMAHGLSEDL